MRFTSAPTSRRSASGFTLIEMLIIAPIVILIISAFIAVMITMVGDVLVSRDQTAITYDTQDALDRIEQDARTSLSFLTTSGGLPSPQGKDNNFTGTAAFTSTTGALIFNEPTTDFPLNSEWRYPVYYANQPNPCGPAESYNKIFPTYVIYFLKGGSLWRRTYLPTYNTNATPDANTICTDQTATPYAKNSCSPGYSASTRCQTNDEEIMQNVDSLNVKYYNDPSSSTDLGAGNANSAVTIEVTINGKKTTAGRTFTTSASTRATKLNGTSGS